MNNHLEQVLSDGIQRLIGDALRITPKNPKQSAFLLQAAAAARKAARRRHAFEQAGEHIPPILIASITGSCNLRCAGCYARAGHVCHDSQELPLIMWERVFADAEALGVSVILLAGGEPFLRYDVLEAAAGHKKLLFPVFTNGTLLGDRAMGLLDSHRSLIPMVSIEGGEAATDARRGQGVYKQTVETMRRLRQSGLFFGASVTVTSDNLDVVTDSVYMDSLEKMGCKAVLFVEYVPVERPELALGGDDRDKLAARVREARTRQKGMIVISFPGDEAELGGCLAAGRGFFHISAAGGAEPCPFSPYSDVNLRNVSLREALKSPLFARLREEGVLTAAHTGGCVLFEQKEMVSEFVS
ncbi:MAG: radical SAM protein [Oscillospiraceae bacterium]|jgi:MoaA/NifB/PqqE/SkfB family radical SAM enzyme|nr:radical SAM protein [Oscillospiraceae bacterium]